MGKFKNKLIGISIFSVLFCSIFACCFFSYNAQNTGADRFGMIHEKNILLNNSNSNLETNTNVQSNIALNINERADVPNLQDDYTNPSVSNMNDYQIAKPEDANFECLGSDNPEDVAYEKLINAKRNKQYLQLKDDDDTTVTFYYKYKDKTLYINAEKIDDNYVEVIQKSSDKPGDPAWFANNKSMEEVIIENKVSPLYTTSWFSPCNEANAKKFPISHLKTISGLGNLDMSNVRDTSYMFTGVGSEKSNCFPVLKSTDSSSDNAYWSGNELTMNSLVSARAMFALSLINAGFKAGNASDGGGSIVVKTTGGSLTDTGYMFQKCAMWNGRAGNEKKLDLSNFNMSNVESADYMLNWVRGYEIDDDSKLPYYYEDTQIDNLVMGNVNVETLENAKSMLSGNSKLSYIDLSKWTGSASGKNFSSMFADDNALETIFVAEGTDWSNVSGKYMFTKGGKSALTNLVGGRGSDGAAIKSFDATGAFVDGKLNPKTLKNNEKGYFTTEYKVKADGTTLTDRNASGEQEYTVPQGATWSVDTDNNTITASLSSQVYATFYATPKTTGKLSAASLAPSTGTSINVENDDYLVMSGTISATFAQVYTVDFDMNDHGYQVPAQTVVQGDQVLKPETPIAGNYKFDGWYTSEDFTSSVPYDFDTPVESSFTLYARWKGAAKITFEPGESYDGTLKDKEWEGFTGEYGGAVYKYFDLGTPFTDVLAEWNNSSTGKVTAATKTGYDFKYFKIWEQQQTQDVITDDVTLWYPQWTAQTYDIEYYDRDGAQYSGDNGSDLIKKHTYGTPTELWNGTKSGFTFDGWFTASDCTGKPVKSLGATDYTKGPIKLYAKWTEVTQKYTATVLKGEGEVFNSTELQGQNWQEDSSGNWYKKFNIGTAYSTILAEWGDSSSWSTATSVSRPGSKLNEIKTDDTGTELVKNTEFYATWTPIDTILKNPDLTADNPVGIFNDFSSGTVTLLKSNSELLTDSKLTAAKAEGDKRNKILVAASNGEDVSDADMGWACSAEETPEVAYAGDENRNPQRFTLMDKNGTSVKTVEFVGAYVDNTDPDNPVVVSPDAPTKGSGVGQYEDTPINVALNNKEDIKAYKVHLEDGNYGLVVHSYGYIFSNNESCAYMFYNFKETTSINTKKLHFEGTTIDGQTYPGVTNTTHMFYDCQSMKGFGSNNVNASNFDTSKVTDMGHMFYNCLQATYITMPYNYFKTDNVVNMKSMFANCQAVTSLDCSHFNTINVLDTSYMFYQCYNATTINIANQAATGSDPEYWNTSSITNMSHMFHECRSVTSLSVGGWKTSNVQNFENLFYNCKLVKVFDVFNWDTISATTMKSMFNRCYAWEGSISFGSVPPTETWQAGPLDKWDTRNVTNMAYMFYDCASLTSINVQRFITCIRYGTAGNYTYKGVEDMYMMFRGCKKAQYIYTTPYNANEKKIESGCWITRACKSYAFMFHQCFDLKEVRTSQFMVAAMKDDGSKTFNSLHWIPDWDTSERTRTNGWGFQSMFAGYTDDKTGQQLYMDDLKVIYNNDSTDLGATNCNWWNGVGAPSEVDAERLGWDCRFHSMFFNCSALTKRTECKSKFDDLSNANNMYATSYQNGGFFTKL